MSHDCVSCYALRAIVPFPFTWNHWHTTASCATKFLSYLGDMLGDVFGDGNHTIQDYGSGESKGVTIHSLDIDFRGRFTVRVRVFTFSGTDKAVFKSTRGTVADIFTCSAFRRLLKNFCRILGESNNIDGINWLSALSPPPFLSRRLTLPPSDVPSVDPSDVPSVDPSDVPSVDPSDVTPQN